MVENILVTGIRESNMEKVSISMQKERRNMENGNMANVLDGLKTDFYITQ